MTNDDARQLYREAIEQYEAGEYAGALEVLDGILDAQPDFHDAAYYRALCLKALGRDAEARACCDALTEHMAPEALQAITDGLEPPEAPEAEEEGAIETEESEAVDKGDSVFVVQSVYPVSAGESSVVGRVTQGVFHVNTVAKVTGKSGKRVAAPIKRIGPADTPILLAREGQRTVLVLEIAPDELDAGVSIIGEGREAESDPETDTTPATEKTILLERPAELAPVERLIKQGGYSEAAKLLENYVDGHADSVVAKRMLAQVFLEAEPPLRDPQKALKLIREVYQASGVEDPLVTKVLAYAQAENGDPEMGLRFMERLYAATMEVEAKQAVAQRIYEFRHKYNLGDVWEFADEHGDVIFEASAPEEIIRALRNGAVPLNCECRRNHVGQFEPIETALAPVLPEVANLYGIQQSQWTPGFLVLVFFLLLGIIVAWYLPDILQMLQ